MSLPYDILACITDQLGSRGMGTIDDPESSVYWSLSGHQLAAYRSDRISSLEAFSQNHLKLLSTVSPEFREVVMRRLRSPLVIQDAEDIHRTIEELNSAAKCNSPARYASTIEVAIKENLWTGVFELLGRHADFLHSLTLDVGQEVQYLVPETLYETLSRLHRMNSFVYRAGLTGVWINHRALLNLLISWPDLVDLTVFQLYGTSAMESDPEAPPLNLAQCRLRSLHLRRMCNVSENDLRSILNNSTESLEELTIVFDRTPHQKESQRYFRGLKAEALKSVVCSCRKIRTLRVGDLVARSGDYQLAGHDVEYDPFDGPIGYIVDELVRSLSELRTLEMSGRIFSMDLFDNLQMGGITLKYLTILRYPEFPMFKFLEHLSANPALQMLSVLRIGLEIQMSGDEREKLILMCESKKIKLDWLRVSSEEVTDDGEMHLVEWSDSDEELLSGDEDEMDVMDISEY